MGMNELKETKIKNFMHYNFDNMMNINDSNPKNIKIDKKSCKDILVYYIRYEPPKASLY